MGESIVGSWGSSSGESERRWVREIRNNFVPIGDGGGISYSEFNTPYSVYTVPQTFTQTKPQAYAPQIIGLGPYHHLRPDLYKMQKQKLAAVREPQIPDKLHYIQQVVGSLVSLEPVVRAFYDRFLDLEHETLAWIMAVDGLFLLRYLKSALEIITESNVHDCPEMENLVGDILMLENQIPSFLLRKIGVFYRSCLVKDEGIEVHRAYVDVLLNGGFLAFCQKHSPLKLSKKWSVVRNTDQVHLLHRMYHLIVNKRRDEVEMSLILCDVVENSSELIKDDSNSDFPTTKDFNPPCSIKDIHHNAYNVDIMLDKVFPAEDRHLSLAVSEDNQTITRDDTLAHLLHHMYHVVGVIIGNDVRDSITSHDFSVTNMAHLIRKEAFNRSSTSVLETIQQIPKVLADLGVPGAGNVNRFLTIIGQVPWDKVSALRGPHPPSPPVEQIGIPTVTDMSKTLEITFKLTSGGIRDAKFDPEAKILFLPELTMTTHTETILRNLLAYEAASAKLQSTLELAEYVDLMCGIIVTETDVAILRNAKILKGDLPDGEAVGFFNGIRKTTGELGEGNTEKSNIGKAITEINKMYGNKWNVKAKRKVNEYAASVMPYIKVVVTLVVVMLLMLQAFCTLFGCNRWFGRKSSVTLKGFSDE